MTAIKAKTLSKNLDSNRRQTSKSFNFITINEDKKFMLSKKSVKLTLVHRQKGWSKISPTCQPKRLPNTSSKSRKR